MVNDLRDIGIGFRYTPEQAARFRHEGWWGDEILLDHLDRWTLEAPDRELVTDGVGRLTYGQARGEAYRLAYTRLWDADERMMRRRETLSGWTARPLRRPIPLGPITELRPRLPLTLEIDGTSVRDGDAVKTVPADFRCLE